MRSIHLLLGAVAALALAAACSKSDHHDVSHDAQDAAKSARAAFDRAAHDPAIKRVRSDLRKMGHDAAQETRRSAAEARAAANSLASDARQAAHRAGEGANDRTKDRPGNG
jgi:hypothetical protein